MSKEESLEPGIEPEDQENELDPIRDLDDALTEKEEVLGETHRWNPAVDWDPNSGYGPSSKRSDIPYEPDCFASEQPSSPLKRSAIRSFISQLISKFFASRN